MVNEEIVPEPRKYTRAWFVAQGRKGPKARTAATTPERRKAIARKAAAASVLARAKSSQESTHDES